MNLPGNLEMKSLACSCPCVGLLFETNSLTSAIGSLLLPSSKINFGIVLLRPGCQKSLSAHGRKQKPQVLNRHLGHPAELPRCPLLSKSYNYVITPMCKGSKRGILWIREPLFMRILRFRIRDDKCIEDSGWVEVGSVTALVGKNESGKTAALEALQKFNSKAAVPFAVKDFPRPKQKTYDPDKICVEVEVEPTKEERASLAEIIPELKRGPNKFVIGKNYANLFIVDLGLPDSYQPPSLEQCVPGIEEELRRDIKSEEDTFSQELGRT